MFGGVLWKKVFLKILQNSQENTCTRVSSLIKLQLKKRLWYRFFPVNFAKFLGTPFFREHLPWLLLKWDGLNIVSVIQYFPSFKNFAALQIFFYVFFEAVKYYFVFELRLIFIFFQIVIFTTLFQRCSTLWISKLKMATLFRRLTLFKSTLKWTALIQRCSTL